MARTCSAGVSIGVIKRSELASVIDGVLGMAVLGMGDWLVPSFK